MRTLLKKIWIVACFCSIHSLVVSANGITSGLTFYAHTLPKEKRTSLQLNPDRPFMLPNGFTLDFDVKFREERHNYGYIFRIVVDETTSFDLVSNFSSKSRKLNFVEGSHIYYSFDEEALTNYVTGSWAHVRFMVTPTEITLRFNEYEVHLPCDYPTLKHCRFFFGLVDAKNFDTAEVPPMTIRDVRIADSNAELVAYWSLSEHQQELVYDSLSNRQARVLNPIWEIDNHTIWKKEVSYSGLPVYTQSAYHHVDNSFYFANRSFILRYDTENHQTDTLLPLKGNPYIEQYNQLISHPYLNQLWSYDFDRLELSVYDVALNSWSFADLELKNPDYSQHNAFVSHLDSALYTFGGYGNYRYKNSLKRKREEHSPWEEIPYSPSIPPRYLAGLGVMGDSLLLFGGYGNESGIQEMGTSAWYDLYRMDMKTFTPEKLWTLERPEEPFVVGSSLIVYPQRNLFFALCYPNSFSNSYILLKSFDLHTGDCRVYGDTIPYAFDDVNSFCTLHLNEDSTRLYAVISNNRNNMSEVSLYSLAYPPLLSEQIRQEVDNRNYWWCPIALLTLLLLTAGVKRLRREKKRILPAETTPIEEGTGKELFPSRKPHTRSAILFLGGFQVWNDKEENITAQFTPVLKQLLVLIVLYGKKNKKGITNSILRETLWADKSEESFLNNRRVSLHKLKKIVEEIQGFEIAKNNIYLTVSTGETTYCDYFAAIDFMNRIAGKEQVSEEEVRHFPIDLLAEPLLPFIQRDWLDDFKSDYSNRVLDTMLVLSKQPFIRSNNELLIRIADIMFAHDKTDEQALALKCKALWESGKISLAKSVYDSFCAKYRSLLNVEYNKELKELTERE
ncbi:hypothetical protein LJC35_04465 [Parabacteroides sp. OttesenSCG-928-N08]|nr:hypothetical protein [Parabacteroides sp. OttesenSCG-928-N08]